MAWVRFFGRGACHLHRHVFHDRLTHSPMGWHAYPSRLPPPSSERRPRQPQPTPVYRPNGTLLRLRQPHRLVHPHQSPAHRPPPPRGHHSRSPPSTPLACQFRNRPPRTRGHTLVPRLPHPSLPHPPRQRAAPPAAHPAAPPPSTAHPAPARHRHLHPTTHTHATPYSYLPARTSGGATSLLPLPRPTPPQRHPMRRPDPPPHPLPPPRPHPRRTSGQLDPHVLDVRPRRAHSPRITDGRLQPEPPALLGTAALACPAMSPPRNRPTRTRPGAGRMGGLQPATPPRPHALPPAPRHPTPTSHSRQIVPPRKQQPPTRPPSSTTEPRC